ncbi:hypothetical protein PTTG_07166 [Puccinia triticina 1-1 BBBD Race 1]|uniref:Uncharacterized protein n=1 Tax=Puccinia triticina (isolate 1-1 / race 1 (BBBD)) TaxID=630390 RepID=A0A180G928_PUCT1|nr:hypothetical protein PTTG_07166 [Puccinia triticina 1-1 BBBD Race 1]
MLRNNLNSSQTPVRALRPSPIRPRAGQSVPPGGARVTQGNRYNPLTGGSRLQSLLTPDAEPRRDPTGVNANFFLQDDTLTPMEVALTVENENHVPESIQAAEDREGLEVAAMFAPGTQTNSVAQVVQDLITQMNFDDDTASLVNRLLTVPREDQWSVSVVLAVANNNQLGLRHHAAIDDAPVVALAPHTYTNTIRTFLRLQIRALLTVGDLHAYSQTRTTGGLPIARSPLLLLMTRLAGQPAAYITEHLPTGWPTDHLANQSVLQMMRVLLKHERGMLRNLLLSNIKEFNRHPIDGPVPKLSDLILIIDRHMGPADGIRSAEDIQADYTATMMVRLAFIRLQVVYHYLNPDPATNLSQWEIIDRQLEFLRRQSIHYKQAYARLVIQRDRDLFGDFHFQDMERDMIVLPTENEVQHKITMAATAPTTQFAPVDHVVDKAAFN